MHVTVSKAARKPRLSVTYPKRFGRRCKNVFQMGLLLKETFGVRNAQRWILTEALVRTFLTADRRFAHKDDFWKTPNDYVAAIAHREISWISKYAVYKPASDPLQTSQAQFSPEAHIYLLQKFLKVAPYLLPQDAELAASTLWRRDIHPGNVFVNDGVITTLIDWQATWAGPLIIQARQPRLLNHKGQTIGVFRLEI